MGECFRCGISGERVKLYDAISSKGLVKVCNECASIEDIPVIKKPDERATASPKQVSVQERLNSMNKNKLGEVTLRDLIDKNFGAQKSPLPSDLIDNFHWTIQRVRRLRKISRTQFANDIGETEATMKMVENGFLPENNYKIINKIEGYLRISLRKPGASGFPETSVQKEIPNKLSFDNSSVRNLKISDIKEMTKKREEKIFDKPIDTWEDEYAQDDEKFLDELENWDDKE